MKLYEYESKALLAKAGFPVPKGKLVSKPQEITDAAKPPAPGTPAAPSGTPATPGNEGSVVKAQVLAGKRGKAGAIKVTKTVNEAVETARRLLGSVVLNETVQYVYLEELVDIEKEFYASIALDTLTKTPVLLFSTMGGVDIEQVARDKPSAIHRLPLSPNGPIGAYELRAWLKKAGVESALVSPMADQLSKLHAFFLSHDCRLAEINPLVKTKQGKLSFTGAALIIDDDSTYRQPDVLKLPARSAFNRPLTERELTAKVIDEHDYRGIAGKYISLDGDIAMMTSGGGGSLTNMDALLAVGGMPANYTEYGGNPPSEKMYQLTKVILSKPKLSAAWLVGGIANNTRVDVTFEGIAKALREMKPDFPIVIRRAGPGEKEGFELMRKLAEECKLDLHLYGADMRMTATAPIVHDLAQKYKAKHGAMNAKPIVQSVKTIILSPDKKKFLLLKRKARAFRGSVNTDDVTGGKREPSDANTEATAVREALEESGLNVKILTRITCWSTEREKDILNGTTFLGVLERHEDPKKVKLESGEENFEAFEWRDLHDAKNPAQLAPWLQSDLESAKLWLAKMAAVGTKK